MAYIVVLERSKRGSFYYKVDNGKDLASLYDTLSLAGKDGLQIVTISNPNDYKEYEPYTEIKTVGELLFVVGGICLGR